MPIPRSLHATPASDSFFLFVLGLGGINKIVTAISSREAPSRTGREGSEGVEDRAWAQGLLNK